jgi:hypothetical protein
MHCDHKAIAWRKRLDLVASAFSQLPNQSPLEYEKSCVLLIDELDKVDHAFEAVLIKLETGQAKIVSS